MLFNFSHKFLGKFLFKSQGLKKILADYFNIFSIRVFWSVTLIMNLGLWTFTWLMVRKLPQDLAILHYNITFGVDSLGSPNQLYWLPLVGLLLFLANAIITMFFYKRDKFLLNLLLSSNIFINIVIGLALYSIYLINYVKLF
jgi:hypothetical protein